MDILADYEKDEYIVPLDEGRTILEFKPTATELYLDLPGLCQTKNMTRITIRYDEDLVVPYEGGELIKLIRNLLRPAEDMTRINIGKRMLDGGDEK